MSREYWAVCDGCGTREQLKREEPRPRSWYSIDHGTKGDMLLMCSLKCIRDHSSRAIETAAAPKRTTDWTAVNAALEVP